MTDWWPVGHPSALAGDPAQVRRLSSALADRASGWADADRRLRGLDPTAVWAGRAVDSFERARDRVAEVAVDLVDMAEAARRGLDRWADELEELQDQGRRVRDHAREALDDLERARDGLDEVVAFQRGEARAVGVGEVPRPWPGSDWPLQRSIAQDRLEAAQRAFRRLESEHDRAARAAAAAITDRLVTIDPFDDLGAWSWRAARASGLVTSTGDMQFARTDDGLVLVDPVHADELIAQLRHEGRWDAFATAEMGDPTAELGARLDVVRALGVEPSAYAELLGVYRQRRALDEAGIGWADWDITRGADVLAPLVVKVYDYYGQVFRDNPELEWAGLANLVGPSFAAGFLDLAMLRRLLTSDGGVWGPDSVGPDPSAAFPDTPWLHDAEDEPQRDRWVEEVTFYEQTFLRMQQEIFLDMGGQHQAWIDGGLPAIDEMHAAGLLARDRNRSADEQALRSWRLVERGLHSDRSWDLHEAARGMAYREQHDIIQDDYSDMRHRALTGEFATTAMSIAGQVSLPGARPMGEENPVRLAVPNPPPHPATVYEIEIAQDNVAIFEERWRYFEADTLPVYLGLLDASGGKQHVSDLTAGEMQDRIEEFRAVRRIDNLLFDWRIRVGTEGCSE